MFSFTPDKFVETLPLLGKGMVGIFIVTAVLVLSITILNKAASRKTGE